VLYQVSIAIYLNTMAPKDCDIHNAVDWPPNRSSGPARA
jgi:hypothetical protein